MPDELHPMTDEFRSWITEGLQDRARWLAAMYDFDDHNDYPVYFASDEELAAHRAKWGDDFIYLFELSGSEEDIVLRIRQYWTAQHAESSRQTEQGFRLSAE